MGPQHFPQNTSSSKCGFSYELPKCHCENASNSNSDCYYHGTLGNVKTNEINPIYYCRSQGAKANKTTDAFLQHYDNAYKDFTHNDLTYNINKCGITYNRIYL